MAGEISNPRLFYESVGRSTDGIVAIQKQADHANELVGKLDEDVRKVIRVDYVGFDGEREGASTLSIRGILPRGASDEFVKRVEKEIAKIGSECNKAFPVDDSSLPTVKLYGDNPQ